MFVFEVNDNPTHPREVEVKATDSDGVELKIVIWKEHNVSCNWSVGETYKLKGGRAHRYEDVTGPEVRIHSNSEFNVDLFKKITDSLQLLVVGDTHVGYRHRSSSKKKRWAKSVDNRETFSKSFHRARDMGVDAVLHAGDVFDHSTTKGDRNKVGLEIQRTHKAGIPVYFVHGNHDNQSEKRTLSESPAAHINNKGVTIGQEPVQVLGNDYSGGKLSGHPPYGGIKSTNNPSILVIHDTPYPAVDENGSEIYRNDSNQLDLSGFLDKSGNLLDLIVAGHMHVGRQGSIEGYDIPLLVTGPTSTISSYEKENRPSTWLLTISEGDIEIERHTL